MRVGEPVEAAAALRKSLRRLGAGASIQSAPNTIRNAVVLLDRQGRTDLAAPLIGWLTANPVGVPGTPGMRQHANQLRERLAEQLGADVGSAALNHGAEATTAEIIVLAAEAIDTLPKPN
jgi:hypothetical protein